ncbi:MAG: 2,3-diphosphoglycerate synthetase [Actinomycetota bacterium]|nr:2,3-diphosphoglycerate synthetase [Actinomycetota bacterium]
MLDARFLVLGFPSGARPNPRPTPRSPSIRYVVIIDGEHYPPVVTAALDDIERDGDEVVAALLAGGREKLPGSGTPDYGGRKVLSGDDPRAVLDAALAPGEIEAVIDLSDEPVLDYRTRHQLAAVALARGVPYRGSDFTFMPPPRPRIAAKPTVAVIGTGKRTGKTAVAGFAARALTAAGIAPIVVAMGRGGPAEPAVLRGDEIELDAHALLELADSGEHAASDYVEDALLGRVPTVGCRRCGGGLAGGVEHSNVAAGLVLANDLPGDVILLEGSGSSIPPAHADATILVVPASVPDEYLLGYMGPYRLLLADSVVVTMCEDPFGSPSRVAEVSSHIRSAYRSAVDEGTRGEIELVRTVFRPVPTSSIRGREAFVATTAPEAVGDQIRRHLETEHGCRVVGISHALSDRSRLEQDMASIGDKADTLLVEIKAAGIDVATRAALKAGMDVVYMDNEPRGVVGEKDPAALIVRTADLAIDRYRRARA